MRRHSTWPVAQFAAALFAGLLLVAPLHAQTVRTPLSTLLAGGESAAGLTSGINRFSEFTFQSTGGVPIGPPTLNVLLLGESLISTLAFRSASDGTTYAAGSTVAFTIGYRVDRPDADEGSVGLWFNGRVPTAGPGQATASVLETVTLAGGQHLALDIFNDGPGRLIDTNSDGVALSAGTNTMRLDNSVSLVVNPGGGTIDLSFVNNIVEPLPDNLPEPIAAVALAPLTLLLLRRRHPPRPIN